MLELKPGPTHIELKVANNRRSIIVLSPRRHGFKGKDLKNLELLVKLGLPSYFKVYFDIKVKHHLIHGPYNVLPKKEQKIVTPYI